MSFREVVSSSAAPLKPLFYEVFSKTQEEADTVLHLPGREKASRLADEFFTYLQENLELFNGADPDLNTLIERLEPYKSNQLKIEPLLQKIIRDLRVQNRRLMDVSSKKVVPFSSSLAAFPLPIVDTTKECAELTSQFLRKQKDNFSLSETLEMCCLLVSQNMQTQATFLFNFHTLRHFIKNSQEFTDHLLGYAQEAQWTLHPDAVRINISILRNHFKASIIESAYRDLLSRIPPDLFNWIQNGGPGEKELFQGYEHLAKQDYAKAFECYKQAADLGNSQALVEMGTCYWNGKGVPAKDYAKAFECYKQAADLGNSQALVKMGTCYRTGNGVPAKDYAKAFECYKQAADLGNSQALVEMGTCYWNGKGVPKSDQRAFEYWLKAKKLDHNYGALNVAKCLTWGRGTQKNQEEAKTILLGLISRNVADANTFYAENF
jgi:TPR repeat protein